MFVRTLLAALVLQLGLGTAVGQRPGPRNVQLPGQGVAYIGLGVGSSTLYDVFSDGRLEKPRKIRIGSSGSSNFGLIGFDLLGGSLVGVTDNRSGADYRNHVVRVDQRYLTGSTVLGTAAGPLGVPAFTGDVAIRGDGTTLMLDQGGRLYRVVQNRATLWADTGVRDSATGLALDSQGRLYLLSTGRSAILELDPGNGSVVRSIPLGVTTSGPYAALDICPESEILAVVAADVEGQGPSLLRIDLRSGAKSILGKLLAPGGQRVNLGGLRLSGCNLGPRVLDPIPLPDPEPFEVFCSSWTPWLNRDKPDGRGDYETLQDFLAAGQACANPTAIECSTASGGKPWQETGQKYRCEPAVGGVCVNAEQGGKRCQDYRVRFCCE